MNLQLRFD